MIRCAPILFCAVAAIVLADIKDGTAQGTRDPYEVKSVYLYHFCRYVEWPPNVVPGDDKMFVIGVVGPDVFGKYLDALTAQKVGDKKIVVQRYASASDYKPCHILFIAPDATTDKRLAEVLDKVKNKPVLLVSDTEGFARKGVVFNFIIEENNVKIEFNPDAAKRAKLPVNAQIPRLPQVKIIRDN